MMLESPPEAAVALMKQIDALAQDHRDVLHGLQAAALKFEAIQLRLQSLENQLAEILARTEKG
jgi:hypothetical protein